MTESVKPRRRTWSASLPPLSGKSFAVEPRVFEIASPPFTPQELTLLDHEVGVLGHILWTSHNKGLLSYSGINLDESAARGLSKIAAKYRPFLAALDAEELLLVTDSVDQKLSRARNQQDLLDQANPLAECPDARALIRMIRPVLPGIDGVKNLLRYYHLSQQGKL